jgi:hypothetical protein
VGLKRSLEAHGIVLLLLKLQYLQDMQFQSNSVIRVIRFIWFGLIGLASLTIRIFTSNRLIQFFQNKGVTPTRLLKEFY